MGIIYFGSGLILLIALWYIWAVNNLIAKRNRVKQCRSGICVALKQRNDMIPNLVAAVKSYMGHENEILTPSRNFVHILSNLHRKPNK